MSKSNPVHLWRFGRTRTLIFTQKWLNRAKIGVLHGTPKNFLRPNKSVSRVLKTPLSKINWKIQNISSGLITRRLYFLKKYDTKWLKFPPCRNWPICRSYFIKSQSDFHQISILLFLLLQLFKLYLFPNLCANPVIITCIENSILFKFKCYDNGWSCKFLSDPGVPGPIFVSGYPSVRQWVKHIVET